jgi:RNA-directed DNA polymerase
MYKKHAKVQVTWYTNFSQVGSIKGFLKNPAGLFLRDFNLINKTCLTPRAPDAGDSAAFSSSFLRLSLFPIGRRPAARPSAGNANRSAAGSFTHVGKNNVIMKKIIDLSNEEAKAYFLKGSSYFNSEIPNYISFEPILADVAKILNGKNFTDFQSSTPSNFSGVNYSFLSNKDGKFAWRPFELIHPAIYVSLVNVICNPDNWENIQKRFSEFKGGAVECCSAPVVSVDNQKDVATQIKSWWHHAEQQSLIYSLEFSHVLQTDVVDCYGSLYTHSISWAIHGLKHAKENKGKPSLLGTKIDSHIQASRYGQTNGISQGSVLMDFVAEIVLGYTDEQINLVLGKPTDFRILRYRDDYRIFANSDGRVEEILKVVSQQLMSVGMKLGVSKTILSRNTVEASVKPDKLAGIDLQDLLIFEKSKSIN